MMSFTSNLLLPFISIWKVKNRLCMLCMCMLTATMPLPFCLLSQNILTSDFFAGHICSQTTKQGPYNTIQFNALHVRFSVSLYLSLFHSVSLTLSLCLSFVRLLLLCFRWLEFVIRQSFSLNFSVSDFVSFLL